MSVGKGRPDRPVPRGAASGASVGGCSLALIARLRIEPAHESDHAFAIGLDHVIGDLAIQRIAQLIKLDEPRARIRCVQHRPVPAVAKPLPQRLGLGVKIQDRAVFAQARAARRAHDRAAAGREHDARKARQLVDHRLLAIAKARLAFDLENRRNGDAEPRLELVVGVDETLVETTRELPPERGLARAHESHEKKIAPVQRHRGIVNGVRAIKRGPIKSARFYCGADRIYAAYRTDVSDSLTILGVRKISSSVFSLDRNVDLKRFPTPGMSPRKGTLSVVRMMVSSYIPPITAVSPFATAIVVTTVFVSIAGADPPPAWGT